MLLILDLAVPRDVDPVIGERNEVYLYSVDDLQAACERNRQERRREWPKAKRIIDEETARFVGDLHHRATGPVIQRLRDHASEMKREEWIRLENRLKQMNVSEEARSEIEKSLDRLVNKLLHPPLSSLRDDAAAGHQRGLLEAIKQLFFTRRLRIAGNKCPVPFARNSPFGCFAQKVPDTYFPLIAKRRTVDTASSKRAHR